MHKTVSYTHYTTQEINFCLMFFHKPFGGGQSYFLGMGVKKFYCQHYILITSDIMEMSVEIKL